MIQLSHLFFSLRVCWRKGEKEEAEQEEAEQEKEEEEEKNPKPWL